MNTINSKLLKKFFTLADKRLSGEWVIIGGVVLHLVDLDYRSTSDIDIIFLNNQNHNEVSLALMEISEKLGLPLNAINRAGEYFLTKANYKRQDLIQVYIGKSITIYRPNLELFVRLKVGRFSESDLMDCEHYLQFAMTHDEIVNASSIIKVIETAIANSDFEEKVNRLKKLKIAVRKALK